LERKEVCVSGNPGPTIPHTTNWIIIMNKVPSITALQFAVLGVLTNGEISGQELRDELSKRGISKSGPAFYQIMARLEDAKFVEGCYVQTVIDGQPIKERRYKLTAKGNATWERAYDFYVRFASSVSAGVANA
jgi:DNA-binding PadR family transcriptional regulator